MYLNADDALLFPTSFRLFSACGEEEGCMHVIYFIDHVAVCAVILYFCVETLSAASRVIRFRTGSLQPKWHVEGLPL
jgi:hypothetical protein